MIDTQQNGRYDQYIKIAFVGSMMKASTKLRRNMNDMKRLTLKEISQRIGISVATVDRVLNNRGNVKPETYRKVMDKLNEMNYTPNKSASFLSRKKELSIAVVFPELPDYFWWQVEKGVNVAYEELRDYGLYVELFKSEKYDMEKQKQVVEDIIASKAFDAIAISPNDSEEMADLIDRGIEAGIAICTFNNDSPLSKRLFYVGCDYRIAGRLAANMLCKITGPDAKFGLITSDASSEPSATTFQLQQKIMGFREVIADYRVELTQLLKLKQEEYDSASIFESFFDQVDAVYVTSAKLHAVGKHLEQLGLAGKKALIGHDITEEIYDDLQRDVVTATICQDPVNQGYLAIKTLFGYLAYGERINVKENITKLELVIKENARYYI
ncbi:substrate-binding domain-containing protein [Paenibacillus lautus]|uniref:substrate-binding domain-containing protein n=1 Tax=Paenibacillus lautus TaxID=1401 RepID=UPI000FDC8F94|nr:substrate-binding domain-containing protein [Paenibacillus lautus]